MAVRYNEMRDSRANGNDEFSDEVMKEVFCFREAALLLDVEKEMLDKAKDLTGEEENNVWIN